MKYEIKREDMLTIKNINYDLYQLLMGCRVDDKDYCESLDKEKLKKECELGYFNIEDLFTKEQIIKAVELSNTPDNYTTTEEFLRDLINLLSKNDFSCNCGKQNYTEHFKAEAKEYYIRGDINTPNDLQKMFAGYIFACGGSQFCMP